LSLMRNLSVFIEWLWPQWVWLTRLF